MNEQALQQNDPHLPALSVREHLNGKHIFVTGVTGFVGKVLLTMIATQIPNVRKLSILIRSNRNYPDAQQRFDAEVVTSEPFKAIQKRLDQEYGSGYFETWLKKTISPVTGDITAAQLGMSDENYRSLTKDDPIDIILHCAGNVNFDPPLNEALEVNTLGAAHKVEFAKAAGCPLVHMSTCFVVGERSGDIFENIPVVGYTPTGSGFDPKREVEDAKALIERWRLEARDQANEELFRIEARAAIKKRDLNPDSEALLEKEIQKQRDQWLKKNLRDAGMERAKRWGWTNTYTYSKSLGEQLTTQLAADAGVPLSIVRPAIVESAHSFPFEGWNEGINTCAPIVYLYWKGQRLSPSNPDNILDVIPVDWVCRGTLLAAAELLEGTAPLIYQFSTGAEKPLHMRRAIELTNLAWRAQYDKDFGPLKRHLMRNLDSVPVSSAQYERMGAPAVKRVTRQLSGLLGSLPRPARQLLKPVEQGVKALNKASNAADTIFSLFAPFILENNPVFRSDHALHATERLIDEERALFGYPVHELDWRSYWIDIHMAGLQRWAFGEMDKKLKRARLKAPEHDLVSLFHRVCDEHAHRRALHYFSSDGLQVTYTYADLWRAARSVAQALKTHGLTQEDRVLLVGRNEPAWPMIYLGGLLADITWVPVDHEMPIDEVLRIVEAAEAKLILHHEEWGGSSECHLGASSLMTWGEALQVEPLSDQTLHLKDRSEQLASLLFTSGTTGTPKGVMLTHKNFCALLASLHGVFKVNHRDHFLSVLPLFHTFEFSAGLLMPLSAGGQITYLSDREGPTLRKAIKEVRPTGIIGIPALWDVLEKRIKSQVEDRGEVARLLFEASTALNRQARQLGLNFGPLLFNEVHENLGGRIRYLISGGAALNDKVLDVFEGLGFQLLEGYGLTEAAPVLTVRKPSSKSGAGSVGHPLPGITVKIHQPDEHGIGEVIARGDNVMRGYVNHPDATNEVLKEGWLHTGDLGRFDDQGNLVLTGRSKEMIVTSSGKNVYPDELEPLFADHEFIEELSIVGIPDPQGDERVAALIVLTDDAPDNARAEVKAHINTINATRPDHQRLRTYRFWPDALPRTATRKVKRSQVREELIRLIEVSREARRVAASDQVTQEPQRESLRWMISSLSALTGSSASELHGKTHLTSDLGLSSLQRVELRMMIEDRLGSPLDGNLYASAETLDALVDLLDGMSSQEGAIDDVEEETPLWRRLPEPLTSLGKRAVDLGRSAAFNSLYNVKIKGREHIPFNQQAIVIANHSSHLDIGLIKEALSPYGDSLCVLAAQDYFFDTEYKEALLGQFTMLLPIDRTAPLERSLRPAEDAVAQGYSVLIYPEGTRSVDGELQEFKLGVGYLQRRTGLPVLPLFIKGTHRAFPKGGSFPKFGRTLSARIGPLVESNIFADRCSDKRRHEQYQEATQVCREAIEALRDGTQYPWDQPEEVEQNTSGGERLMLELCEKYRAEQVSKPITWYFSLGERADDKWTLSVDVEGVQYLMGKPQGGKADCVLKTDLPLFTRMVREGYIPSFSEFAEGRVKTNSPDHLRAFQTVFGL